jgi:Leucine Rich Repeat (LRR) protein
VATAVVLFFANVPGQEVLHPDIHDMGKYGPHWEGCTPYYEHGWPCMYLKREKYPSLNLAATLRGDRSPWDFGTSGERIHWTAVVVNGMVAGAMLSAIFVVTQVWSRRRDSKWQFRLVDLFAGVAILSAGLAWYAWNRQEHIREMQMIQSLRRVAERVRSQSIPDQELHLEFELQPGGPTFIHRFLPDAPFRVFDRVVQCDFLSEAPEFATQFRNLRVFRTHIITGEIGEHLSKIRNLEAIDFCFANVVADNDERQASFWNEFPALPQLRCINLHYTGSDACTTWLARCANLERITLTDCDISDAGAANLAQLKRLKILDISGQGFTEKGCRLLSTLPELEELWLESPDAGDGAMKYLSQMRSLKKLSLYKMPITNDGLLHLSALRSLEELSVEHTNVTGDGLKKLRSHLPNCSIYHQP